MAPLAYTVFLALWVTILQCGLVSSLATPKKNGQPGKNPSAPTAKAVKAELVVSKKNSVALAAPTVKALAVQQTVTTTTALLSSGSVITENHLFEKLSETLAALQSAQNTVNQLKAVNRALTQRNQE